MKTKKKSHKWKAKEHNTIRLQSHLVQIKSYTFGIMALNFLFFVMALS